MQMADKDDRVTAISAAMTDGVGLEGFCRKFPKRFYDVGIAEGHSVIMDGRDIGTKVLPNATLKLYLTASPEVRARRRCDELAQKGMPEPYEQVLKEMLERDYQDSHRAASPLRPAEDAVELDNSDLDLEGTVAAMKRLALAAIEKA